MESSGEFERALRGAVQYALDTRFTEILELKPVQEEACFTSSSGKMCLRCYRLDATLSQLRYEKNHLAPGIHPDELVPFSLMNNDIEAGYVTFVVTNIL